MGAVRLNFGDSSARTIFPDELTPDDFIGLFVLFVDDADEDNMIAFTVGEAGKIEDWEDFENINLDDPIELPAGKYHLAVLGFTDITYYNEAANADTGSLIGNGGISYTKGGEYIDIVDIVADVETTIYVRLLPIGRVGSGTLAYNITINIPGDFEAQLTLTPHDSTQVDVYYAPVFATSSNMEGFWEKVVCRFFYYVDLTVTKKDLNGNTIGTFVHRELAHIYHGMTTTFTYTVTDDLIISRKPIPNGKTRIDLVDPVYSSKIIFNIIDTNLYSTLTLPSGTEDDPIIITRGDATAQYPQELTIVALPPVYYRWVKSTEVYSIFINNLTLNGDSHTVDEPFYITLVLQDYPDDDNPDQYGTRLDKNDETQRIWFKIID
jgi:hypothetical protein